MTFRRSPSPPATPPPRLAAQEYTFPEPSPSKLIAVREEETNETVQQFSELILESQEQEQEQDNAQLEMRHPRPLPFAPRGSGDTLSHLSSQFARPRNRSPYSRPHLRSQSSSGSLAAPPMTRAHSSPAFSPSPVSFIPSVRSSSPLRSPKRTRSPFGTPLEEQYLPSAAMSDIESIDEDHELDITPRPLETRIPSSIYTSDSPSFQLFNSNSFPVRKRRPASPLYHVTSVNSSAPTSTPHSPSLSAQKFNESFPSELSYTRSFSSTSVSSMPSTPTSLRSRSPSISSLETIPDTPDAEAEAIEAENLERLRRASEGGGSESVKPRTNLGFGSRDKRKRWSVCGAEKRSDLNLETIWED